MKKKDIHAQTMEEKLIYMKDKQYHTDMINSLKLNTAN